MNNLLHLQYSTIKEIENSSKKLQCICTINAQHLFLIKTGVDILNSQKLVYTVDSQWVKKILNKYVDRRVCVTTGVHITDYIFQKAAGDHHH